MKKLIATFAAMAAMALSSTFASFQVPGYSCDLTVYGTAHMGFATENIMWGKKVGKEVIYTGFELSTPVWYGDLYTGITGFFPLDPKRNSPFRHLDDAGNRLEYTLGYKMNIYCLSMPECFCMDDAQLSLDFGYKYIWWPQERLSHPFNKVNRDNILYVGLLADTFLNPSLYYQYDWNLQQSVIELAISYTYPLCFCGMDNLALEFDASLAFLFADKYNGDQSRISLAEPDHDNGYTYGSVSGAVVYSFTDCAKLKIGMTWVGNNDGGTNTPNNADGSFDHNYVNQGGTESRFFWGSELSFAF